MVKQESSLWKIKKGYIERSARGVYIFPEVGEDEMLNLQSQMRVIDLMTEGLDYISFAKREEIFSYQNEYRYLIADESANGDNIRFNIGSLKDIATIISKSEFLNTL